MCVSFQFLYSSSHDSVPEIFIIPVFSFYKVLVPLPRPTFTPLFQEDFPSPLLKVSLLLIRFLKVFLSFTAFMNIIIIILIVYLSH